MNNKVNKKKFNQRGGGFTKEDLLVGFVGLLILGAIGGVISVIVIYNK